MQNFDREQKTSFLQFVTGIKKYLSDFYQKGTSKVPLDGFKALKGINGF